VVRDTVNGVNAVDAVDAVMPDGGTDYCLGL